MTQSKTPLISWKIVWSGAQQCYSLAISPRNLRCENERVVSGIRYQCQRVLLLPVSALCEVSTNQQSSR